MPDSRKKLAGLQKKLKSLRIRIAELEKSKQAEESLQKNESLYRTLMKNINLGITLIDTKYRVITTNAGQGKILKKPHGKLAGKYCYKEFEKRRAVCPHCPGKQAMATGRPAEAETEGVRDDGSRVPARIQAFPVLETDGTIKGFIEVVEDVTKQKRAEENLRESEQRFKAIFDNAVDGILLVNAKTKKFCLGNKAMCKMLGYKSEDIKNLTISDIHPKERLSYVMEKFDKQAKGETTVAEDIPVKRKDGSVFYADTNSFSITLSGKTYLAGIFRDITERKKNREELRRAEAKYKTLVEQIPAVTYTTALDKSSTTAYISPQILDLAGFSPEECGADPDLWRKLLHPEDRQRVLDGLKQSQKGKHPFNCEYRILSKDGSVVWCRDEAVVVRDSSGRPLMLQGVMFDITTQKRAEEKLMESEQRFKAIFDNASDGILLTDAKTKKFYLGNKATCKMLGYRPEEIKNLTVLDITPKELSSYAIEQFGKIAKGESSQVGEGGVPIKRKDGSIFYAAISAFPITFGGKTYITGVLRDITAHKKAEEALRTSEAQLLNAMKIAKLGYWEYDVASNLFTFNDQFYSIFRTSAEKVGGYKMSPARYAKQFLHPDDVPAVSTETKKAIETTDPHYSRLLEHRIIYADGEIGHIAVRIFVVKDEHGRTVKTFGANQDITEYKKAQEELRQAEAKYRILVEQIPAVTYTAALDKASTTTYISPQVKKFIGFSPEEYRADPDIWHKQLHPDDRERVLDALHQSHKSKNSFLCEYRMFNKKGKVVWCRDEAVVVPDSSGKPLMLQGVMFDITSQKRAEEELNVYREKMAQAERLASLGTLSATVAHELTQPLTVIRLSIENSLEDLKAASCPKDVLGLLKDGLNEVSNATSVIDRFRNYARQSSRKTLCKTNLGAIAGRIVHLLGKTAQRAKMALHLKGMDKLPLVYSNEKDLDQLFFALTENAIQAADGKKNRRLIIKGAVKGENVELQFSDNCCGIAPENLDKIFEPFFTTGNGDERTGLGLPIVQRIVSENGGKIDVRSRPGKGTIFYVTLPIPPGMAK
ncbi:MAG: PAS domain S-box protein [Phycisphaerae bacterium]|jgi:PAS domain S-box-containing protein